MTITAAQVDALPDRSVVPAVWSRYTDLVVDRGEGSWLVTVDGDRYLDYSSGIGVTNTGHAHPRVVAAIQGQAAKLLHGQQNIVYHEPGLRLHERLRHVLPGDGWAAFLSNSGAEAVEAAVKLARVATGRPAVVAFRGGFHGRTAQTMALSSSRTSVRGNFEPLPGSIYHAPYPACYRAPDGPHDPDQCTCDWEAQLDGLFAQLRHREAPTMTTSAARQPAANPRSLLHCLLPAACCLLFAAAPARADDALRTELATVAKGIASGLPLSGIIAREDLLRHFTPGIHGGTYGGNVVSCAAANATLDVIEDEGLVANAAARGTQLIEGLRALKGRHPRLGDVRGLGCMVALEFVRPVPGDGRMPDAKMAQAVLAAALERRLIMLSAGSWGQVVRIIPPLVTTEAEVAQAVGIVDEAMTAAAA